MKPDSTPGIRFWKMTGAGNDFIVFPFGHDAFGGETADFVRRICRRGLEVGADGVLFVTPAASSGDAQADAVLVHYNADGGRSAFCGNGTRCAAGFAVVAGFSSSPLRLRTDIGPVRAEVRGENVRIEVPAPSEPVRVNLEAAGATYEGWRVAAGVPHVVILVDDPATIDVARIGPVLRSHAALGPEGANIDFVQRRPAAAGIRLRTFERGVEGETLACGSGALATAAVLAREGVSAPIILLPASGTPLTVEFEPAPGGPSGFRLSGEARVVFEGRLPAGTARVAEPS